MLTAEYLRSRLDYDRDTGIFIWRTKAVRRPQDTTWNTRYAGKVAGSPVVRGYIGVRIDGRVYYAHRLAWLYVTGEWPVAGVDHENRFTSDNRFDNLRPATQSQNNANRAAPKTNTSGVKGVSWCKARGVWVAKIKVQRRTIYVSSHKEIGAAANAYAEVARGYFGEFGRAA